MDPNQNNSNQPVPQGLPVPEANQAGSGPTWAAQAPVQNIDDYPQVNAPIPPQGVPVAQQQQEQQQPLLQPQQPQQDTVIIVQPLQPTNPGQQPNANYGTVETAKDFGPSGPFNNVQYMSEDIRIDIRHGFVRKVFGILSCQLLLTCAVCAPFTIWLEPMTEWAMDNEWVYFVSMGMYVTAFPVLCCCPGLLRRTPWNYILLFVFTLGMSGMVAFFTLLFTTQYENLFHASQY